MQDVGATLGLIHLTPDIRINPGVGFRSFAGHPVWAPFRACTAVVTSVAPNATLHSASIGEAGRAFLAQRLSQLTRADIKALVEASQIEKLGGPSEDEWTDAIVGKVKEIEKPCAK